MQFVHSLTLPPSLTSLSGAMQGRKEQLTAVFPLSLVHLHICRERRAGGESRSLGGLFASASCKRPTASLLDGRREGVMGFSSRRGRRERRESQLQEAEDATTEERERRARAGMRRQLSASRLMESERSGRASGLRRRSTATAAASDLIGHRTFCPFSSIHSVAKRSR